MSYLKAKPIQPRKTVTGSPYRLPTTLALLFFLLQSAAASAVETTLVLDRRYASLDLAAFIDQHRPQLNPFASQILLQAGHHSVSPLALMVLVEDALALPANKMPGPVSPPIEQLAMALHHTLNPLSGSVAEKRVSTDRSLENLTAATEQLAKLVGMSLQPFPKAGPQPKMDLPFAYDQEWEFFGAHTYTGDDDGSPMSSIDFSENWSQRWNTDTSNSRVLAAHDGIAQVFGPCNLRISHPSGWSTQYYHLEDIVVKTGQSVKKGQDLSKYADDRLTAVCQGGFSQAPHLHFTLLRDGRYVSIDGLQLGQHRIKAGRHSYDNNHQFSWIDRGDQRLFAVNDALVHQATFNTEVDLTFDGLWFPPQLPGHGMSLMVRDAADDTGTDVAVVLYTYDDGGQANFYAGSSRVQSWNLGASISLPLFQSAGGGFSAMRAIDFDNAAEFTQAGEVELSFDDCANGQLSLQLTERSSGQPVAQQWQISRLLGDGCVSVR